MKNKEEILDHLSKTVYTHNARKSIVECMLQMGYIKSKSDVKFANHVYNRDGVMMTKGLSFEDFVSWTFKTSLVDNVISFTGKIQGITEETAYDFARMFSKDWTVSNHKIIIEDFQIGDAVKYIPTPDESSTEYIEAIAHGSNGEMYLCLSNGEWVNPCYCVKYKVQGEERRKLIDKLNETI